MPNEKLFTRLLARSHHSYRVVCRVACLVSFLLIFSSAYPVPNPSKSHVSEGSVVEYRSTSSDFAQSELDRSTAMDPRSGKPFIVSVRFTLLRLPREGRRVSILSKYSSSRKLSVGWGIFLRRTKTSVRPEIYWKGTNAGDFFTFDRVPFQINQEYIFTLVGTTDEFVSMYIQPLSRSTPEGPIGGRDTEPDLPADKVMFRGAAEADSERAGAVRFAGGVAVAEFGDLSNPAPILLGDARTDDSRLIGRISEVFVAYPETLPKTRIAIEKLVNGGPTALAGRLSEKEIGFRYRGPSPNAR